MTVQMRACSLVASRHTHRPRSKQAGLGRGTAGTPPCALRDAWSFLGWGKKKVSKAPCPSKSQTQGNARRGLPGQSIAHPGPASHVGADGQRMSPSASSPSVSSELPSSPASLRRNTRGRWRRVGRRSSGHSALATSTGKQSSRTPRRGQRSAGCPQAACNPAAPRTHAAHACLEPHAPSMFPHSRLTRAQLEMWTELEVVPFCRQQGLKAQRRYVSCRGHTGVSLRENLGPLIFQGLNQASDNTHIRFYIQSLSLERASASQLLSGEKN